MIVDKVFPLLRVITVSVKSVYHMSHNVRKWTFGHVPLGKIWTSMHNMKISLLINMKMPTIVGIFIFISRETFMFSWVELNFFKPQHLYLEVFTRFCTWPWKQNLLVPWSDIISDVVLKVTVKFSSASFSSHNATIFSWPLTWFSQRKDSVTVIKLHKASWWPWIVSSWCLTRSVCLFFVEAMTLSQKVFHLSTVTSTKMRSCST